VTVQASQIAIDVNGQIRTLRTCVLCVVGLGRRLKLFFAEPTARWVGVKPEPIEEPVQFRCDHNHSPNAVVMRAILVNNLDSLINIE
jgi:hypothetical protein